MQPKQRNILNAERFVCFANKLIATAIRFILFAFRIISTAFRFIQSAERNINYSIGNIASVNRIIITAKQTEKKGLQITSVAVAQLPFLEILFPKHKILTSFNHF